jgi:lactate permease
MDASPLNVLLAAVPPLLVLILMVGLRWGGTKAGTAGWIAALLIAILRFGAGLDVLFYAHVRSIVLTIDVAYIVWAALLLYYVVHESGGLQVIADWFTGLTGDEVLRVLLLGWVFTSFLQGVGGFGVPVAVVAPLLVGLGLSPLLAIVIPSIGHAWAVTFGSLGSSFIALIGVTGMDDTTVAAPTAILLGIGCLACGLVAAQAYGGWRGMFHALPAILLIGTVMAAGQYILATNELWNIGAAGGSLMGLVVGLAVTRLPRYSTKRKANVEIARIPATQNEPATTGNERAIPTFPMAIAGYILLVILAVLLVGVQPIKEALGQVKPSVSVPAVETAFGWKIEASPELGLPVLIHTGSVLVYSAAIAYFLYKSRGYYQPGTGRRIMTQVRKQGLKTALGILTMVCMAKVMENAGMTRTLAEWLSKAVPPDLYAFVATAIGSLGAFMTGSNTNSNAVFGTLQMDTALLLGLSVPMVLATQTASAAICSLLSPAKIIVGASTVGMTGDEGAVLRALLLYGGLLVALIAVAAFIFLQAGY